MNKLKILFCFCIPLLVLSCTPEGKDTLIIPSEGYTGGLEATIDKEIIPEYIQEDLENDMPIYEGKKPPVVEGAYLLSPLETVFSSDGGYTPGYVIDDFILRFSNQNAKKNTLSYEGKHAGGESNESSDKVSIIGKGKNFTAYFITEGTSIGISYSAATLVSGTVTSSGISDIYYAFIMLEKGYDPEHKLIDADVYRIFKDGDGLAENTTWNKSALISDSGLFLKQGIVARVK